MSGARRYPPNRRLTWERLQRGWSYEEVAAQIKRSMDQHAEPDTGLIPNTVRRWETGERWPDPRFRKHLVLIFGKPAADLGLLTPDELAMRPEDDDAFDLARRLLTMVNSERDFNRGTFLRGLLGAGLLPAVAPLGATADAVERLGHAAKVAAGPDDAAVSSFSGIASRQRELYWSTPAPVLFESALAHTQLGVHLLRATTGADRRGHLAAALAESALLTARLAFFDLGQVAVAQRCFDTAREATEQSGDHALAAAVFAHMSFIPGFSGDRTSATALIQAAHSHARYAPGPRLRSWLHCVASEIAARTGDPEQSVRHARQANDSLATGGADPLWLDFYDASRLDCFTGYSHLVAGNHSEAATSLESALGALDPLATKQRAVVLFDLATAHAQGDAERAAGYARDGIAALELDWYGAAYDRIPALGQALHGTPYAAELSDRVRALPPSR